MANKAFSIRLSEEDKYRLRKISELRTKIYDQQSPYILKPDLPWSDIIKHAIYRMYNETIEYYMYEEEMFKKID